MRNFLDNICRESKKIQDVFSTFFFFENRTFYEIMWKNIVERGRPQMAIWRMRIACWILKATRTHSEYVIRIAFPLQNYLHELASVIRHTCIIVSCK